MVVERDRAVLDDETPWRCFGHPPLALPAVVDGVELGWDTNWAALSRIERRLVHILDWAGSDELARAIRAAS